MSDNRGRELAPGKLFPEAVGTLDVFHADFTDFTYPQSVPLLFRLFSLATDHPGLAANPSCRDVEREARRRGITEAILVGWCERSAPRP